ncbi:MAG: response regulator [Spirochaetes bacterium]|nr:response regulator [Spirochaetota bacterium]
MKRKKIFIVEDSRIVALELQKILEGLGYYVVGQAGTGADAVDMCAETVPELVLMDVKLPGGMNGIEASKEIRKRLNVPVIYTTAYSDREIVDEVQKSFPFGFVIKPYREKDLLVAIETAFTRFEYERKLEESEQKYKSLFEGSSDIIFTLDENWKLLTANWAAMSHLNIKPDELIGRNLFDLIYASPEGKSQEVNFVREKIDLFTRNRRPIGFKTAFMSNFNNEPVEMNVRLEYIAVTGGSLVIGRAFRVVEDELMKFFLFEEQGIVMGNQLFLVGDVSDRISRNLGRYCDFDTVELTRLALVEMIINAIEHGNLEITFAEKSRALEAGNYFEFVTERQGRPEYRGRTVRIESSIRGDEARYTITDSGAGFDHRNFFAREMADINAGFTPHGRGILMSKKIFDDVSYNDSGNSVILVKKLGPERRE